MEGISAKDTLYLRLENANIVKLSPNDYMPKYNKYNGTEYNLKYIVTEDQAKAMSGSPISSVRINLDKVVDFDTRGSRGEKFMEAVACVMK